MKYCKVKDISVYLKPLAEVGLAVDFRGQILTLDGRIPDLFEKQV